ncbi:MAG: hypothetical protein QG597_3892 [Actinomycetota bacterium]|nr:hypothetical protein [Actinomycetota bacterium]
MGAHTIEGELLPVAATLDIPIVEVSGLTIAVREGVEYLVAVGDDGADFAWARLTDGRPGQWRVADLASLLATAQAPTDQLEAVCTDPAGRLIVAQEEPSRLFVLDTDADTLVATLTLDATTDAFLAPVWDAAANSRAESAVLLPGGRVLVVKEKRPICLAVFGPREDFDPPTLDLVGAASMTGPWGGVDVGTTTRLAAQASWPAGKRLERLGDVSDATLGPDGALYLLSDQGSAIARVAELREPGSKVRLTHVWPIAGRPVKCEGLAFAADGTCFVGIDTRKPTANLLVIQAPAFSL